jgi:hypothetical protein
MYKLILFWCTILLLSCQNKQTISPTDPEFTKSEINEQIINPALQQGNLLKDKPLSLKINKSLAKFRAQYPEEYVKFSQVYGEIEKANFLKGNRKFKKIWKELGYPKKELMQIIHIRKSE